MQRKIISFSIDFCNYIIIKLNALQKWNGDITLILLFFEQKFSSSYYLQMAIPFTDMRQQTNVKTCIYYVEKNVCCPQNCECLQMCRVWTIMLVMKLAEHSIIFFSGKIWNS